MDQEPDFFPEGVFPDKGLCFETLNIWLMFIFIYFTVKTLYNGFYICQTECGLLLICHTYDKGSYTKCMPS